MRQAYPQAQMIKTLRKIWLTFLLTKSQEKNRQYQKRSCQTKQMKIASRAITTFHLTHLILRPMTIPRCLIMKRHCRPQIQMNYSIRASMAFARGAFHRFTVYRKMKVNSFFFSKFSNSLKLRRYLKKNYISI